jgi:hypothetical protein
MDFSFVAIISVMLLVVFAVIGFVFFVEHRRKLEREAAEQKARLDALDERLARARATPRKFFTPTALVGATGSNSPRFATGSTGSTGARYYTDPSRRSDTEDEDAISPALGAAALYALSQKDNNTDPFEGGQGGTFGGAGASGGWDSTSSDSSKSETVDYTPIASDDTQCTSSDYSSSSDSSSSDSSSSYDSGSSSGGGDS